VRTRHGGSAFRADLGEAAIGGVSRDGGARHPTFASTPGQLPDLMAAAIEKRDLAAWAAREGIVAARG
jgi:hypothetical protein